MNREAITLPVPGNRAVPMPVHFSWPSSCWRSPAAMPRLRVQSVGASGAPRSLAPTRFVQFGTGRPCS